MGLDADKILLKDVAVTAQALYTFWAAKRGRYFDYLGPFLLGVCCASYGLWDDSGNYGLKTVGSQMHILEEMVKG